MDNFEEGGRRLGLAGDPDSIMSLTLMRYFDFGDNIVLQYMFNFAIISILPMIIANGKDFYVWLWQTLKDLFVSLFCTAPEEQIYCYLDLTALEKGRRIEASPETNAWLWHIRTVVIPELTKVDPDDIDEEKFLDRFTQKMAPKTDYWDRDSDTEDGKSIWWPTEGAVFEIFEDITCTIRHKKNESHHDEGSGDDKSKKLILEEETEIFLELSTSLDRGVTYLLEQTETIRKKYQKHLEDKLTQGPQIFYYDAEDANSSRRSYYWDEPDDGGTWTNIPFSSTRKMEHLWFAQKESFLKAYNNFLNNKEDYEFRGDPHTFSALLYGAPGCGKTSLIKAVVNYDLDRGVTSHVINVNIADLQNVQALRNVMFNKKINNFNIPLDKRIYIFEDFDAATGAKIFHKRELLDKERKKQRKLRMKAMARQMKVQKLRKKLQDGEDVDIAEFEKNQELLDSDGEDHGVSSWFASDEYSGGSKSISTLTLSNILNVLDGVNERTGMRCFWTTNVMPPSDYFDPAFLRPGRIDMCIELTKCNHEGLSYLIGFYFRCEIHSEEVKEIDEWRWTPAEVKQICKQSNDSGEAISELVRASAAARTKEEAETRAAAARKNARDEIKLAKQKSMLQKQQDKKPKSSTEKATEIRAIEAADNPKDDISISSLAGLVASPMKKVASISGHEIPHRAPPKTMILLDAMTPEVSLEPE